MPRKCTICTSKKVDKINQLILQSVSFRHISSRVYGDKRKYRSIHRHSVECLKLDCQAFQEQVRKEKAVDFHLQLKELLGYALKFKNASEKWMTDPNNPNEFTLNPRDDEIEVVFTSFDPENEDSGFFSTTLTLKEVTELMSEGGLKPISYNIKSMDNRDFALKTIDRIDKVLDKFAKIQGLYKEKEQHPNNLTPEQQAQSFYNELIRKEAFKDKEDKALKVTRDRYPTFEPKQEYVN